MNEKNIVSFRDSRIEWIRIAAIYCVIFQHMVHADSLASIKILTHGAVPAFAFLSVFFAAKAGTLPTQSWRWLATRCLRLYGLFLVWNMIYFVTRMAGSLSGAPTTFHGFSMDSFFLSGYDNALWFIPYILFANALAFTIARLSGGLGKSNMKALATLTGATALALATWHGYASVKPGMILLDLSRKAAPASLAALSFLLYLRHSDRSPFDWRFSRLAAGILFLVSCWWMLSNHRDIFLPESVLGLSAIILGLSLIPNRIFTPEPDYALFLFVSHSLFIHILRKVLFFCGVNWDGCSATVHLTGFISLLATMTVAYRIVRCNCIGALFLLRGGFPGKSRMPAKSTLTVGA